MRSAIAIPLLVLGLLTPAAAARGAVVVLGAGSGGYGIEVVALPGERNDLSVALTADNGLVVAEAGDGPLVPGNGCVGGDRRVICTPPPTSPPSPALVISVGDGNDRVSLLGLDAYRYAYVGGGAGEDVLVGGPGQDELAGQDGADLISGGAHRDQLDGGLGDDVMSGGPGRDTVTYWSRRRPVSVTLGGTDGNGEAGESDAIAADVERVEGGGAGDRLFGSDGPDRLSGRFGDDVLDGRGGDDILRVHRESAGSLTGGAGRDLIAPGVGSRVDARDAEPDRVGCRLLERVPSADPFDELRQCVPPLRIVTSLAPYAGGVVRLSVHCGGVAQPCRAALVARDDGGAVIGRGRIRARPGRSVVPLALAFAEPPEFVQYTLRVTRERPPASRSRLLHGSFALEVA